MKKISGCCFSDGSFFAMSAKRKNRSTAVIWDVLGRIRRISIYKCSQNATKIKVLTCVNIRWHWFVSALFSALCLLTAFCWFQKQNFFEAKCLTNSKLNLEIGLKRLRDLPRSKWWLNKVALLDQAILFVCKRLELNDVEYTLALAPVKWKRETDETLPLDVIHNETFETMWY